MVTIFYPFLLFFYFFNGYFYLYKRLVLHIFLKLNIFFFHHAPECVFLFRKCAYYKIVRENLQPLFIPRIDSLVQI